MSLLWLGQMASQCGDSIYQIGLLWIVLDLSGSTSVTGMVWDGITFIPLYFIKSLSAAAILVTIHAVAIPLLVVPRTSLIQDIVPTNMTGRIFALMHLSVLGMASISAGLSGLILELINAPTLFLLIGIGGGLCGVAGWIFAKDLRMSE